MPHNMLRLQEVKSDLANAALGKGSGVKLHRISVKEIQAVGALFHAPVSGLPFDPLA
ncbi:hypothetical protein EDD16DRAFT_1639751, partial [Pisolithus croceorrhizus]